MRPTCLLFTIFFSWSYFACVAQKKNLKVFLTDSTKTIKQWKVHEIVLMSEKEYADPFNDVIVDAVFSGPHGEIIKRPAFWDGGKSWKVRFAPTKKGIWKLQTYCTDTSNHGLNNITGSFDCKSYTGNLEIFKRGFLKVSPDKRYFVYDDGKPFFYLGDTHWLYIHERFNTSNVKNIPSQFKYIVDKRVTQGFTVYQTEAIQHPHAQNAAQGGSHSGNDEEASCDFRDGFNEVDLKGFENIDRKFKYIADKGLVNANSSVCWALDPAEFPEAYSEQYMYRLGRYWAARYGAYPVLWTIAQEVDKNMYNKYDTSSIRKWFQLAKGIADNDAYQHPLTAHMENTGSTIASTSWWRNKPYHQWWSVQWQGDMTDNKIAKDFWFSSPVKPAVLYESPYEGFWTDEKGAREAGYKAFQYGIYGYGYGANGIWNDLYSTKPPDYGTDYEMPGRYLSWYDGANLPGAAQLIFLKRFYTSSHWWNLVPRFDDTTWSNFLDKNQSMLSTDGQRKFVVYFFNRVTATGVLNNLLTSVAYSATWYNTRTGMYTKIGSFKSNDGTWRIPQKPDSNDWILLVQKKE